MIINPETRKRWQRFKSLRRGYFSLLLMGAMIFASLFAELWINNRALLVVHQGHIYLPTYGDFLPGTTFGENYDWETNYRALAEKIKIEKNGDFILMPLIPYNPFENDFIEGEYPPYAPSAHNKHYLGTDTSGRDILARLVYGFRIAILFSLFLLAISYTAGISIGALMGYFGGKFDLITQRIIEILSNIPGLYVIMIIASIVTPSFWSLALLLAAFSWMGLTWYMRTETYREVNREYVTAAHSLGASHLRIITHHILPNTIAILITFFPFSVAAGITALTSLDYLGFGLPAPTPSWGELLQQGTDNLEYQWITASAVTALSLVLILVNFIGEAVREAFDPKTHTFYE